MDDDRIRWVPSSEQPNELISLRQARQLLIERVSGSALVAFVGDSPTTIGWRGEFANMVSGGSKLKADLTRRAELAKVEATQEFACDWIREQLGSGESKFYRVEKRNPSVPIRGPLVIEAALPEVWQSSERDRRVLQKLILQRNEDPSGKWWYALDKAAFLALLAIDAATDRSEDPSRVATGAPKASAPSEPAIGAVVGKSARRGRKKGSGTKPDDASLRAMLDLLADGKAPSVLAAARSVVEGTGLPAGNNETSTQNWIDRLRRKFAKKYGTDPPPEKTWDDVRKAGGI